MSSDGKKIKFLCSFGGKIIPRPSDGALRYVGGDTRIISVREGITFSELMWKMLETHGGPVVLKYQLPDEDLDALITVSCPEDLENMMEECKKFEHAESSRKLRLFLFDVPGVAAVSDVAEGTVSAQPRPALLSSSGFPISVNFSECSTVVSSTRHAVAPVMAEPSPLPPLHVPQPTIQSVTAPVVPPIAVQASESLFPQNIYPQEVESLRYVPNYDRIEYVSPPQLGIGGAPTDTVGYVAIAPPVPVALVSGTGAVPPGTGGAFEPYFVGMPIKLSDDPNIPNLQSPPLQPSNSDGYSGGGGGGCTDIHACHGASSPWQNEMRLEECLYCNKHLPHVHSDILTQEHDCRANSSIREAFPLFHSFPVEDGLRLHSPSKMVESANSAGILEHKTEDAVMDSPIVKSNVYYGTDQAQSCIDRSGRRYLLPPYADKSPHGLLSANNMVIEHQEQSHEPHFDAGRVPANNIMLSSSPSGIGVTSAGNAGIQAFEPLSLVAGDKSPLDNHTRQQNGMTEMHHFSPGLPSLDDQRSVDGDANIRASKEMKPIYSQLITDARERRSQINDHEVYPSNSYPTAEEINTLLGIPLSTTLETACLYTTQPFEASLSSLLGNLESYPPKFAAGVKSPIQHEQLFEPEINGQITVGNSNLQTPQIQPGIVFSHVSSHPISDLVSSPIRNSSENVGVNCDSSTSNSLFSNQDPWSIIQDSQMFSPKQKVANKELFNTEVLRNEKLSRNINNGDVSSLLEEGFLHPQPNILDSDLFAEPIKHFQEEHIKRELRATAEGVAALVLQSCDTNESQSQSLNSKGTLNNDKDLQQNIISHDDKFQGANSKELEITDHAFQIPGDIEHLQSWALAHLARFTMESGGALMWQSKELMIDVLLESLQRKSA